MCLDTESRAVWFTPVATRVEMQERVLDLLVSHDGKLLDRQPKPAGGEDVRYGEHLGFARYLRAQHPSATLPSLPQGGAAGQRAEAHI